MTFLNLSKMTSCPIRLSESCWPHYHDSIAALWWTLSSLASCVCTIDAMMCVSHRKKLTVFTVGVWKKATQTLVHRIMKRTIVEWLGTTLNFLSFDMPGMRVQLLLSLCEEKRLLCLAYIISRAVLLWRVFAGNCWCLEDEVFFLFSFFLL